jgi:hypothetical protein
MYIQRPIKIYKVVALIIQYHTSQTNSFQQVVLLSREIFLVKVTNKTIFFKKAQDLSLSATDNTQP